MPRRLFAIARWALLVTIVTLVIPGGRAMLSDAIPWTGDDPSHARAFEFARYDDTGIPYRWYACGTITWRHRIDDPAVLALVRDAVTSTAAATGLHFTELGPTDHTPSGDQPGIGDARLVIATVDPAAIATLSNRDAIGLAMTTHVDYGTVRLITEAGVLIADDLAPGAKLETTVMHELGHAVGLAHVDDPTQVMAPRVNSRNPGRWGAGDLTGLRIAGQLTSDPCPA